MSYLKMGYQQYDKILKAGRLFILTAPMPVKKNIKAISRKDYTNAYFFWDKENIFSLSEEKQIDISEFEKRMSDKFISGYKISIEKQVKYSFLDKVFSKRKLKKLIEIIKEIKKDKTKLVSIAKNVTEEEKQLPYLEFIAKKFKRVI